MKDDQPIKTQKQQKTTNPINKKKDVENNPDMHIDQDFPGYPHGQSKDEMIKPESKTQKKTAGISTIKQK